MLFLQLISLEVKSFNPKVHTKLFDATKLPLRSTQQRARLPVAAAPETPSTHTLASRLLQSNCLRLPLVNFLLVL